MWHNVTYVIKSLSPIKKSDRSNSNKAYHILLVATQSTKNKYFKLWAKRVGVWLIFGQSLHAQLGVLHFFHISSHCIIHLGGEETCSVHLYYPVCTFVSPLLLNMFFQSFSWIVPIYLLFLDAFELSCYESNNVQKRLNLSSCNVVRQAKLSRTRK